MHLNLGLNYDWWDAKGLRLHRSKTFGDNTSFKTTTFRLPTLTNCNSLDVWCYMSLFSLHVKVARYIPIRVSNSACIKAHVERHTYICKSVCRGKYITLRTIRGSLMLQCLRASQMLSIHIHSLARVRHTTSNGTNCWQLGRKRGEWERERRRERGRVGERRRERGRVKQLTLEQLEKVVHKLANKAGTFICLGSV